jgi:hypothetical protein
MSALWPLEGYPQPDNNVYATLEYEGVLYIGGSFLNCGGISRPLVAAIDLKTKELLPFNPMNGLSSGAVYDLLIQNGRLYVAGDFTIAGKTNLVAFDLPDGSILSTFTPDPNGPVYVLAYSEIDFSLSYESAISDGYQGTLLFGGNFTDTAISTSKYFCMCSLELAYGPFHPIATLNGAVRDIKVSKTTYYSPPYDTLVDVVGEFTKNTDTFCDGYTYWLLPYNYPTVITAVGFSPATDHPIETMERFLDIPIGPYTGPIVMFGGSNPLYYYYSGGLYKDIRVPSSPSIPGFNPGYEGPQVHIDRTKSGSIYVSFSGNSLSAPGKLRANSAYFEPDFTSTAKLILHSVMTLLHWVGRSH